MTTIILKKLSLFVYYFFFLSIVCVAQSSYSETPVYKNIALGKTIHASSEGEPASNAIDGEQTSYWQSGSFVGNHWLKIDLEAEYTIDRIVLPLITGVDSLVTEVKSGGSWEIVNAGKPDNPLIGFEPITANQIRLRSINGQQMRVYEVQIFQYDPQPVFVNQMGYDLNRPKRFTAPLAENQTQFVITKEEESLYEGIIENHIGDFTSFQPADDPGPYIILVKGEETGRSIPFEIGPALIEKVSYQPAINFMVDVRCWFGDSRDYSPTDESADCPHAGVAWRDSHQFSFEIQSLLHLYFANPSAFTTDRMPVQGQYLGVREELPKNTPEIIRLIYWAVDIYLRGEVNHTLLKGQLAHFVYAWPWLSEYIPESVYVEARDYLFDIWENEEVNRWGWFDVEHTGNMLQTFTILGTGKGEFPNGHSIVPNLMMYEVAKRENKVDADKFLKAAYDQTVWLIENLDWNDPRTSKGLRAGEWVPLVSFEYFLTQYPDKAPSGLQEKIAGWGEVAIQRSDNMWDFRRYSDERWIIPFVGHEGFDTPETGFNEVGNIAGFPAPALVAASVSNPDQEKRLRILATSQMDHVFGRNPVGRHFGFDATLDFEGAELGWFQEYQGGAGILQVARGVLDGSPKEPTYPYNPHAGDPGHTEGWVTFNTSWNVALAYLAVDVTAIAVYDTDFTNQITSVQSGDEIGVELIAPLNFDNEKQENAEAFIYFGEEKQTITLQEVSHSSPNFRGTITIPENIDSEIIKVAYGYSWFEKAVELSIDR